MKLRESLEECTLALLRRITASHGAAAEETALRAELVDQLCRHLLEPGYFGGFLAGLTPLERELLQMMRSRNWIEKAFVLDRQFPLVKRSGSSGQQSAPSPRVSLTHKGILYRSFAPLGNWRGEVYHIPEELRTPLADLLPADAYPVKTQVEFQPTPEGVIERDGSFDLFCLLSFLSRGRHRLVRGSLGQSEISRLEQELGGVSQTAISDKGEGRWRFLLHLSLANGWITRRGNSLHPTRNAPRLLAGPHGVVRNRLLEGYCKDQSWSDLAAAGKVRQALGSRRIDERAGRRLLLHYLEEFGRGKWIDEQAFIDALRTANPDFLREDYGSPSWGIVDVTTEAGLYGPDSWDLVEGQWIRYLLHGPLYWLGAIRLGTVSLGGKTAIQLVHRSYDQDGSSGATPQSQADILISSNIEVSASTTDSDLALLYRLEPYMELVSRGKISRYRFTKTSVHAALEAGNSWDELRELLQTTRRVSIAESAFKKIEGWAAEYGRYLLESMLMIRTSSPEELDSLLKLPQVSQYLGPRLGNNSVRVAPERLRQLQEAMKRAGLSLRIDPTVKRQGLQGLATDVGLLQESLFALKLMRTLHSGVGFGDGENAIRRLEAALDPVKTEEVSRRVKDVAKRLTSPCGAPLCEMW